MVVAAGCDHGHRAVVLDAIRILVDARCNCGEALSASAQRKAAETNTATQARAVVQLFIAREFLTACQNPQDYFFENPGGGSALFSDLFPHR